VKVFIYEFSFPKRAVYFGLAIFLLALLVRLQHNVDALSHDEYYHLLAAESWASEGTLRIADGVYSRGWLYTMSLGFLFKIFGSSVLVAKAYGAVVGAALVLALFYWVYRLADGLAAWVAGLLLTFAPIAIEISTFVRFYALHGLLFFLGTVCFYFAVSEIENRRRSVLYLVLSGTALAFAYHLQVTTLIGVLAIALWVSPLVGSKLIRRLSQYSAANRALFLTGVLAVGVLIFPAVLDFGRSLFRTYTVSPIWESADFRRYHWLLQGQYPTLWTCLPLAVIVSLSSNRKAISLSAIILVVSFLFLSSGARQGERFLYFVLPFFFAIWGICISMLAPGLRELIRSANSKVVGNASVRRGAAFLEHGVLVAIVVFLLFTNSAFPMAYRMLTEDQPGDAEAFKQAASKLKPWIEDPQTAIVVTSGVRALYYFGRYDFEYSRPHVLETENGRDFGIDTRTGRPVIGTVQSLRSVLASYECGIFVNNFVPGSIFGPDDETLEFLEKHTEAISLETAKNNSIRAYYWERTESGQTDKRLTACKKVAEDERFRAGGSR
jgi:hypothetical protein